MSGNAKFVLNVFINIIIFIATTEPLSVDFNLLIYVVFSAILALGTKLCFFRCSKPTTVRGGGSCGQPHSLDVDYDVFAPISTQKLPGAS